MDKRDVAKLRMFNTTSIRGVSVNVAVIALSVCVHSAAHAKDDLTSPQYSACIEKSGGNTWSMIECNEATG